MNESVYYSSYKHFMVRLDTASGEIEISDERSGGKAVMRIVGLFVDGKCEIDFAKLTKCKVARGAITGAHTLTARFSSDEFAFPTPELNFTVDAFGVGLRIGELGHYEIRTEGYITYGTDSYAINTKSSSSDALRSAVGPAVSKYDNAIYDRITDSAFVIDGCRKLAMGYDFENGRYTFALATMSEGNAERMRFRIEKDIIANKYGIDYEPMKQRGSIEAPTVGFMTWYSLKFGACESALLENSEIMKKKLGEFGASTVWVDWEWCHRRYERERDDGVDNFHPDPEKYPNGLGYLADKIKEMGLTPALWIGFTNDMAMTDYERKYPEISLSHHDTWSGRYYYDFTEPKYMEKYLTDAVKQVKKWGYNIVKYDTLPNSINAHENYHANMKNPEVTSYTAFRNMAKKTRELLGEDAYMLSCGSAEEVVLWGAGIFDAARINPDLFNWDAFKIAIERLRRYYPLHSNVSYNDIDCIVLRDEYSDMAQARSRIVPVALLGLPVNIGDDLRQLPDERVNLLKLTMPVLKTHPTVLESPNSDGRSQLIVQKIARPDECYTVFGLMNLTDKPLTRSISIDTDLRLADGEYLAYAFFSDSFLGSTKDNILLEVAPNDTAVVVVREKKEHPQLISTSRHLSQGATEIKKAVWCEDDLTLNVTAELIANELYSMAIYTPDGYVAENCSSGRVDFDGNIAKVCITSPVGSDFDFTIKFSKK